MQVEQSLCLHISLYWLVTGLSVYVWDVLFVSYRSSDVGNGGGLWNAGFVQPLVEADGTKLVFF